MTFSTLTSASEVIFLAKDKPAPYSGVLFTEEQAKELRLMSLELETYKKLNESFDKSLKLTEANNELLSTKVNLVTDQNVKLSEALNSARSNSFWEKAGYYALGALSIAVGGFVYSQIKK